MGVPSWGASAAAAAPPVLAVPSVATPPQLLPIVHLQLGAALPRPCLPNHHQAAYMALTVVVLDYLHDAWFYWTHRLLHWRPLYAHVHAIHHR